MKGKCLHVRSMKRFFRELTNFSALHPRTSCTVMICRPPKQICVWDAQYLKAFKPKNSYDEPKAKIKIVSPFIDGPCHPVPMFRGCDASLRHATARTSPPLVPCQ